MLKINMEAHKGCRCRNGIILGISLILIFSSGRMAWAAENAVEQADSMKARGFGVKRRTSYSNYKMETRDWVLIWYILVLAAVVITGLATDRMYTYYYPYFVIKNNAIGYICYNLLCMIPILINIREEIRWHRLKSKI